MGTKKNKKPKSEVGDPFFFPTTNTQLFIAKTEGNDRGFSAFVTPKPEVAPEGISLVNALTDANLQGNFIFSTLAPTLETEKDRHTFVTNVLDATPSARMMLWLEDADNIKEDTVVTMNINSSGKSLSSSFIGPLTSTLSLAIGSGMKLELDGTTLQMGSKSGNPKFSFAGADAPDPSVSFTTFGSLPFTGPSRGCFQFSLFIQRGDLNEKLNWGFQYLIPLVGDPIRTATSEWLPLASGSKPSATNRLGFNITIDPSDVNNKKLACTTGDCTLTDQYASRRTYFNFTGKDFDGTASILAAYYQTVFGKPISLLPENNALTPRLLISSGEEVSDDVADFHFTPEGDFTLQIENATEETYQIQCGLQSTEFFNIKPKTSTYAGDCLRFIGLQAAYAPVYPLPDASPLKVSNQGASLLNNTYTTAWATLQERENASGFMYVAQPKGSALYGNDSTIQTVQPTLLGHKTPGFVFKPNENILFPLIPYGGVVPADGTRGFNKEQIEDFEALILSPLRKNNLSEELKSSQAAARTNLARSAAATTENVTTPTGLLATITGEENQVPIWDAIYLGQNRETAGSSWEKMFFEKPTDDVVQAFQTSDQFLVMANNHYEDAASGAVFNNKMFIGDWTMQSRTGLENEYNNYNNIIIVKGRKGQIYNPNAPTESLVANPAKWTGKDQFAAPTVLNSEGELQAADTAQLVILSQWIQDYCAAALQQEDTTYFQKFNTIIQDPNWTGILILNMNITGLPDNLKGIMAGVANPSGFRAHHFGIEITPVFADAAGPKQDEPSSMFGLIYYVDPDFVDQVNPEPVAPDPSLVYDFRLLTLKVLFENTAVKNFQSLAQLTLNNFFGSNVDHMGAGGNPYNTILLKGSLQFKGTEALYSLGTDSSSGFYFNSPVVNKVEVTKATFSTRQTNSDGSTVSWFALDGYWDFKDLRLQPEAGEAEGTDFDLFSFGNPLDTDNGLQGLKFSNLGIEMIADAAVEGGEAPNKTLTFSSEEIAFDTARSTPRAESLFTNFALTLDGLTNGDSKDSPNKRGFLTVITDLRVTNIAGKAWIGFEYQLNMGSPGELAGKAKLTSSIITAWDPAATIDDKGSGYPPVFVGIKLPGTGGGAKLISLQSVLKLSIGQIQLTYVEEQKSFMLRLTEIALKFLGILKIPPNGSSLFYLFGNPQSEGKASGLGWYAMYKKDA